jgi:hypothetical protein
LKQERRVNHFIDDTEYDFGSEMAVIDSEFRKVVLTHIISNYNPKLKMPMFLAIYGNPGEGKSFQTLRICREHGIKICYFSGAELSGNYERDSILDIDENYTRACNYYYGDEKTPCVIVIDDFHLSPASTQAGVGTTINSQLLTGFLMNLCDKAKNSPDYRVPIILLGNTFENVYEPLKRDGRMDFFHWEASRELKEKIIYKLFGDCIKKRDYFMLRGFVATYIDKPISFFAEIRNDIEKNRIKEIIDSIGRQTIDTYINACSSNYGRKEIGIADIYNMADKRINASKY